MRIEPAHRITHMAACAGNDITGTLPIRIGMLLDHPSPHMTALLDALSERQDCAPYVVYLDHAAPGRTWGAPVAKLPHRFISGLNWPGGVRMNPGIFHVLKAIRVDMWVLSTCYTSPTTLLAASWLDRHKIPWIYVNEPPQPRNSLLTAFRRPILSLLLKKAWGVVGTGKKAEKMYCDILPIDRPTESVPYYIDLDSLYSLPPLAPLADDEPVQFVTSCQMITRKGIDILFHACTLLPAEGWTLTLAGEGPLKSKLERDFAQHWDQSRVRFVGQVPYDERASVFAGKHVFVFPSRWDGWGMVVPEALAAGLPVISGEGVISAHDFIRNSENGYIIAKEDAAELAKHMTFFIENHAVLPRMGLAARRSLDSYRPDVGANRLITFLHDIRKRDVTLMRAQPLQTESRAERETWHSLTSPPCFQSRTRLTARQTAKRLIINTSLKTKPRSVPKGDRILVYHLVLREDKKRFEEHLSFLSDHFRLCTVAELLTPGNREDKGEYRAAISFDDGFRILMGDCLEICQKYGVRATYYVPTGFVQLSASPELVAEYSLRAHYYNLPLEPMRKEDLRLLTDLGHEVDSHGQSHIGLGHLSQEAAQRELTLSMKHIGEWTGRTPTGFAYPYGDSRSSLGKTSEWVRDAGYRYAVTLKRGPITGQNDPFQIPRDHVEGNWRLKDLRYFLLGR